MTKIFGIVNLSVDSFSGDGTLDMEAIKQHIQSAKDKNIYGLDVGAVSTRPNAIIPSEQEEMSRLQILPQIIDLAHKAGLKVALDSFRPETIEFGLKSGIDYINDQTGLSNRHIKNLVVEHKTVKCICMHNLGVPPKKDHIINKSLDVLEVMIGWANNEGQRLSQSGIDKDRIVMDLGIGFGKDVKQSLRILTHFEEIKKEVPYQLYIGHSRKSFLREIVGEDMTKRDIATAMISYSLMQKGCDYIRIHNIELAAIGALLL